MFKIKIQWMREGDWHPTVWPPSTYDRAFMKWAELQQRNPEHRYKLVGASRESVTA